MTDFMEMIFEPLRELFMQFKAFLPGLLAMLVILVLGILLAKAIKAILVRFLTAVNFDSWCDRMGFTTLMRKGDLWTKPSVLAGVIVFWLLLIVTLMVGLSALKVAAIDQMVGQFFGYMPRIFSAAIILVIGYVLSGFVSRAVLITAANSGFHYAKLLAETVRTLLAVLILAMVMEQLQIAPSIVLAAFSIIFGGIVIALSIAFGVGGIDAAKRVIERETAEKRAEETKDEIEHI
ncbi:MAG: hypothetical protein A3F73_04575 [Gallionellales bacterium RIFCSPLOWO2_12_FULL_59_22]|nr:MAG: hypothetical protein A3H99_07100 [Gallionellales bacterium RIFCSPLOWO2_02_FULL_59_110]OGT04483.1 MAG: hypothetical protein A2Z65_08170 [Gallionellales bacterium RIFCSPLOWO2_02_58_13]OGT14259.1 MAG: hypothetical protein A3F73_04575 [Gallionellales bacterium RIFCSPLOWO2_12_FULL_59_22]